ncbi:lytic transglycosylase domain-containing protein, partial [Dermacoccus nishinomiyaensis]
STHAPKPKHVVRYAGTAAARGYPASLVASGDRHRRQLAAADLPGQAQIRAMITSTAKRYGVSPKLALAIGWQESGHRQSAVSVCDALGTMQVMPTTGQWAGSIVHRHLDLLDTQDNITAGVVTLRFLTEHAHDQNEAIAAYYQGLGAVRAHGMYPDTRRYVASVNTHMKRFS